MGQSLAGHDLCGSQQLRTDGQARCFRGIHVDLEANLSALDRELNHSSPAGEILGVADRERVHFSRRCERLFQLPVLGSADKEHLAALDLLRGSKALNRQPSVVHLFAAHDVIEVRAERIVAEHADRQRSALLGEDGGRPVHELREVEQKHGLHLILSRWCGCLRRRAHSEYDKSPSANTERVAPSTSCVVAREYEVRSATSPLPYTLRWISSRVAPGTPNSA